MTFADDGLPEFPEFDVDPPVNVVAENQDGGIFAWPGYEREPVEGVTALMLTQQEWNDLAEMLAYFQRNAGSVLQSSTGRRLHALAERIIEANQP